MDLREAGSKTRSVLGYLSDALEAVTPTVSRSVGDFNAKAAIDEIARASSEPPRILVIGAGDAQFDVDTESHLLYSDVAMGRMTHLICDAHDLAFEDGFFDAVVAVAVLEHVADPYRCVAEIQRVLRPGGYVYAVTPFMQQVHLGRYDFTRFTYLGHRRLFRWFKERRSGVANGPGMAMAWSVERFVLAIGNGKVSRQLLSTLARWLTFPALYLDKWLAKKPIAYDASSAYYFFGEKADTPISDREIVALYKGAGH
jgi:SAM-dependent methyltransferase